MLEEVLKWISNNIVNHNLQPSDMRCIMDIQHKICQLTAKYSNHRQKQNIHSKNDFAGETVHSMLDVYMDVVDTTMDQKKARVWGRVKFILKSIAL